MFVFCFPNCKAETPIVVGSVFESEFDVSAIRAIIMVGAIPCTL